MWNLGGGGHSVQVSHRAQIYVVTALPLLNCRFKSFFKFDPLSSLELFGNWKYIAIIIYLVKYCYKLYSYTELVYLSMVRRDYLGGLNFERKLKKNTIPYLEIILLQKQPIYCVLQRKKIETYETLKWYMLNY
jgi:hypothetical protein